MTENEGLAGAEDGLEDAAPPEVQPLTQEELRLRAVARLAEHLDLGIDLVERCHALSRGRDKDKMEPLNTASRLLAANARIAQAFATVAQIERRTRTISERIQPPDPKKIELISTLENERISSERRERVFERMNELVDQSIRARSGETTERDRAAELLEDEKKTAARIARQLAEAKAG